MPPWGRLEHALVASDGSTTGLEPVVLDSEEFWIGRLPKTKRGKGCDLVLTETVISSRHCKLFRVQNLPSSSALKNDNPEAWTFYLLDSSTNGTFLNNSNKRMAQNKQYKLSPGDSFSLSKNAKSSESNTYHSFTFFPSPPLDSQQESSNKNTDIVPQSADTVDKNADSSGKQHKLNKKRKKDEQEGADQQNLERGKRIRNSTQGEESNADDEWIEKMSKMRKEYDATEKGLREAHEKEIESLKKEREELEKEKTEKEDKLTSARQEIENLQSEIASIKAQAKKAETIKDQKLFDLQNEINKANFEHTTRVNELEAELEASKTKTEQLEQALQEAKQETLRHATKVSEVQQSFEEYKSKISQMIEAKMNSRLVEASETVHFFQKKLKRVSKGADHLLSAILASTTSMKSSLESIVEEFSKSVQSEFSSLLASAALEGSSAKRISFLPSQLDEDLPQLKHDDISATQQQEHGEVDSEDDSGEVCLTQQTHHHTTQVVGRTNVAKIPPTVMEVSEQDESGELFGDVDAVGATLHPETNLSDAEENNNDGEEVVHQSQRAHANQVQSSAEQEQSGSASSGIPRQPSRGSSFGLISQPSLPTAESMPQTIDEENEEESEEHAAMTLQEEVGDRFMQVHVEQEQLQNANNDQPIDASKGEAQVGSEESEEESEEEESEEEEDSDEDFEKHHPKGKEKDRKDGKQSKKRAGSGGSTPQKSSTGSSKTRSPLSKRQLLMQSESSDSEGEDQVSSW